MRQWVRLETDSKAVARRTMARVVAQQNAPSAGQPHLILGEFAT